MAVVRKVDRPKFDKIAAVRGTLGDDPNNYPTELLAALMHQHQFLSEYSVNVQIHKQDDVAGYMYGVFVARPMTAVPNPDTPTIRIPIIVSGRRVFPFDVFITSDGRFQPLTQGRVAASLFSASNVSAVAKSSLPAQAQIGVGGGFPIAGEDMFLNPRYGQSKTASASILEAVVPTVSSEKVAAFLAGIQNSPELMYSVKESTNFANSLRKIASAEPVQYVEDPAELNVSACLVTKNSDGFYLDRMLENEEGIAVAQDRVKLARADVELLPLAIRQEALVNGVAYLSDSTSPLEQVSTDTGALNKVATASGSGVYAAMTKTAKAERVVVLDNVHTLGGKRTDAVLVVGAAGTSLQEKIAGIRCGNIDTSVLSGREPHGRGVFIIGDIVTEPLTVRATLLNADGNVHQADTDLGQRYLLKEAAVSKLASYGSNKMLIPSSAKFIPITQGDSYISDKDKLKFASALKELAGAYTVKSNARGGVDVLNEEDTLVHTTSDAPSTGLLFLALGDTAQGAKEKVAKMCGSSSYSTMRVVPKKKVNTLAKKKPVEKKASALIDITGIRASLVKEAAVLAAPDTIDAVLSLEFVTPENINTYIEFIPTLEDALAKLSETLVGARIGVPDIPENALTSSVTSLDRAIQGLKKLQIRLSLPTDEQTFT
jgi:hypothetical protein